MNIAYLQCQLEFQEFLVAGCSVAEELSIIRVPPDGLCVELHCAGVVT